MTILYLLNITLFYRWVEVPNYIPMIYILPSVAATKSAAEEKETPEIRKLYIFRDKVDGEDRSHLELIEANALIVYYPPHLDHSTFL